MPLFWGGAKDKGRRHRREVKFRSLDGINIMKNRVGGNAVKEGARGRAFVQSANSQ